MLAAPWRQNLKKREILRSEARRCRREKKKRKKNSTRRFRRGVWRGKRKGGKLQNPVWLIPTIFSKGKCSLCRSRAETEKGEEEFRCWGKTYVGYGQKTAKKKRGGNKHHLGPGPPSLSEALTAAVRRKKRKTKRGPSAISGPSSRRRFFPLPGPGRRAPGGGRRGGRRTQPRSCWLTPAREKKKKKKKKNWALMAPHSWIPISAGGIARKGGGQAGDSVSDGKGGEERTLWTAPLHGGGKKKEKKDDVCLGRAAI